MDAKFWDTRYATDEYAYGEAPNSYLVQQLEGLTPAKILFPADGEGRNSVYAATLGWDAWAFDQSAEGKRKAELLAEKKGVAIHYDVVQMPDLKYTANEFDAIALIYAHFGAADKLAYMKQLNTYLKPGGTVIFEAYSKSHLKYKTANPRVGGPADIDMLFSIEELQAVYAGFEMVEMQETELEIQEGAYHTGLGAVIRFTGRKK